ncbi:MAG: poly-gamma-glutamate hydrolase family protein [Desulfobacterales bacterium]
MAMIILSQPPVKTLSCYDLTKNRGAKLELYALILFEMDRYKNYNELRRHQTEGKDYQIYSRQGESGVTVIAPHGGDIEPGTSEIADAVAGHEHSFYAFEGIKNRNNSDLHITSENFDEPKADDLVRKSRIVLCLHGCGGNKEVVYVGGIDQDLKTFVKTRIVNAGFSATNSPGPGLQGTSPSNICNRGRTSKGVQLELSLNLYQL